jgi:hypothetical protein
MPLTSDAVRWITLVSRCVPVAAILFVLQFDPPI